MIVTICMAQSHGKTRACLLHVGEFESMLPRENFNFSKLFFLNCRNIYVSSEQLFCNKPCALKYVSESKYLGFSFSDSKCDDCDMLHQMRSLYA